MMLTNLLHRLARLYGVHTSYVDGLKLQRHAPAEATLSVLQSLGAPIYRLDELADAFRQCRQDRWQNVIEPVIVVWENQPLKLAARVPGHLGDAPASFHIVFEDGAELAGELRDDPLFTKVSRDVEGYQYTRRR